MYLIVINVGGKGECTWPQPPSFPYVVRNSEAPELYTMDKSGSSQSDSVVQSNTICMLLAGSRSLYHDLSGSYILGYSSDSASDVN